MPTNSIQRDQHATVSLVKNAVCLPLPGLPNLGLNFNLGAFSGGSCSGIQLIPALAAAGAQRTGIFGGLRTWGGQ